MQYKIQLVYTGKEKSPEKVKQILLDILKSMRFVKEFDEKQKR